MRTAYEGIDRDGLVSVEEAVAMVKSRATAKFDETIEISMNLGIDPRHADQNVRGAVTLPAGTGKAVRVAVFAKDAKADEAKAAGADIVGAEDLMEQVQAGSIDFERVIATPDMMPTCASRICGVTAITMPLISFPRRSGVSHGWRSTSWFMPHCRVGWGRNCTRCRCRPKPRTKPEPSKSRTDHHGYFHSHPHSV